MKFLRAQSWQTSRSALEEFRYATAAASAQIIEHYSTSFALASHALPPRMRTDIRNLYAMVRIADEIVDGVAEGAGLSPRQAEEILTRFHAEVHEAIRTGFSTNPVLHSFATTARHCQLNPEHIDAFFASMRADISPAQHTEESLSKYIYGSAEVIGLMCLAIFTADHPLSPRVHANCDLGAKALGRAFQKINFLRDYHIDSTALGRQYISLTPESKATFIAGIRRDLSVAYRSLGNLPLSARTGVLSAYLLFSELTDLLDAASISEIEHTRVRVSASRKLLLTARAATLAPRLKEQ
ncbi:phytoene/squalene synthase family protein [Corynebacterium epidermidicanis]|nr:squalene/phytoene synthase family protein [Corynebacterium epidermidicanis]